MKTGHRDLAPAPISNYFVTARVKLRVRLTLPAVALTATVAEPSAAVVTAENFKDVPPLPGAGSMAGLKTAVTPTGIPWTEKLTAELNPPSIAEVNCAVAVPPRLSVSAVLFTLSVVPGISNVKGAVLVTPPPVAVTVNV